MLIIIILKSDVKNSNGIRSTAILRSSVRLVTPGIIVRLKLITKTTNYNVAHRIVEAHHKDAQICIDNFDEETYCIS